MTVRIFGTEAGRGTEAGWRMILCTGKVEMRNSGEGNGLVGKRMSSRIVAERIAPWSLMKQSHWSILQDA